MQALCVLRNVFNVVPMARVTCVGALWICVHAITRDGFAAQQNATHAQFISEYSFAVESVLLDFARHRGTLQ